jgi:hypothetical protein
MPTSIAERARAAGIPASTARNRRLKGWPESQWFLPAPPKPMITARAKVAGLSPGTVAGRKQAGWPESEWFVPPRPNNHRENRARPTKPNHPWRRSPAAGTYRAGLSALELRMRAKREQANG